MFALLRKIAIAAVIALIGYFVARLWLNPGSGSNITDLKGRYVFGSQQWLVEWLPPADPNGNYLYNYSVFPKGQGSPLFQSGQTRVTNFTLLPNGSPPPMDASYRIVVEAMTQSGEGVKLPAVDLELVTNIPPSAGDFSWPFPPWSGPGGLGSIVIQSQWNGSGTTVMAPDDKKLLRLNLFQHYNKTQIPDAVVQGSLSNITPPQPAYGQSGTVNINYIGQIPAWVEETGSRMQAVFALQNQYGVGPASTLLWTT